jgi:hypothetical protein
LAPARFTVSRERAHSTGVESAGSRSSCQPGLWLAKAAIIDLDCLGQSVTALVEARALGQRREQMPQPLERDRQEAVIGADAI